MNKKYTYVWVSLIILVFGIIFIPRIINRIKQGTIVESDRMSGTASPIYLEYVKDSKGNKRKVPAFEFINQDSLVISNADYLGKVYVVEFFFTTCPTICPIMTDNLISIQDEFKDSDAFGVASFTINPRYDTPKVLKEYAEKYGITDLDWHLLTGDREAVYNLANNGFYLGAEENDKVAGGFEHSGMFALVDKQGYIRSRKDKFGNPIIYYRGMVAEEKGVNKDGEKEQISILKQDIKKLLEE
ncbi:SCO family protein [Costertonia aggregata]|uniref:SCO family protein n=1 Tax=Costertonia aggregata TaxID=343403 RepID=A0A7H9AM62_9FLAO|nr:SCO family protein [Costertonia aggregata]QLG44538.1 SCO family protein [Costertonia aggregata]